MRRIVLEGEKFNHDDPVMMMWREYKIAKLFGWTPEQQESLPGGWIDWALQIDRELGG